MGRSTLSVVSNRNVLESEDYEHELAAGISGLNCLHNPKLHKQNLQGQGIAVTSKLRLNIVALKSGVDFAAVECRIRTPVLGCCTQRLYSWLSLEVPPAQERIPYSLSPSSFHIRRAPPLPVAAGTGCSLASRCDWTGPLLVRLRMLPISQYSEFSRP